MSATRRGFLKSGALALFATGIGGVPTFIARAANGNKLSNPYKKNKILVCIFPTWGNGRANGGYAIYRSIP